MLQRRYDNGSDVGFAVRDMDGDKGYTFDKVVHIISAQR